MRLYGLVYHTIQDTGHRIHTDLVQHTILDTEHTLQTDMPDYPPHPGPGSQQSSQAILTLLNLTLNTPPVVDIEQQINTFINQSTTCLCYT